MNAMIMKLREAIDLAERVGPSRAAKRLVQGLREMDAALSAAEQLLSDMARWRRGTSFLRIVEEFGTLADYDEFCQGLWKRFDAATNGGERMSNPQPFGRAASALEARRRMAAAQPAALTPGERVRALRIERRWTQAELAMRADVSQATVWQVERGGRAHSGTAEMLLRVLNTAAPVQRVPAHRIATTRLNWNAERQALLLESPAAFGMTLSAIARAASRRPR